MPLLAIVRILEIFSFSQLDSPSISQVGTNRLSSLYFHDDTSRSLQARVAAILFSFTCKAENPRNSAILQRPSFHNPASTCLVYTGRMSSTFTIRDIVNEDATASVSDYGAHVLSWAPAANRLWFGAKGDSS